MMVEMRDAMTCAPPWYGVITNCSLNGKVLSVQSHRELNGACLCRCMTA